MSNCQPPAAHYWQLQQGDKYGGSNCAAYQAAAGTYFDSCGAHTPTGAQIRAWSSEPIPNPASPGLNLAQLGEVMLSHYGISLDRRINAPWQQVVDASVAGHGVILSVGYDPIRRSSYRGSATFKGGHALFIAQNLLTYDSLADGRLLADGKRAFTGPAVYPEDLLKRAAAALPIEGGSTPGLGRAWFGILPTAHPIPPDTGTDPTGEDFDVNTATDIPVAVADCSGGTVYADSGRQKVLIPNWAGAVGVGLYAHPVHPKLPDGKAALAPVRLDLASGPATDLRVGWVGWDTLSNVRLP